MPEIPGRFSALKQGGYVLVFRHGATDDSQKDLHPFNFDDMKAQRQLSDKGRDTARQIGAALKTLNIPVGAIYTSRLNRAIETDLLPHLQRAGTGAIAFVPFAGGLLTDKYLSGTIPPDSRAALRWGVEQTRRRLTPDRLRTISALNDIARTREQSLAQMALAWILRLPEVTSALIGASSLDQVKENVKALESLAFEESELTQIDELLPA